MILFNHREKARQVHRELYGDFQAVTCISGNFQHY